MAITSHQALKLHQDVYREFARLQTIGEAAFEQAERAEAHARLMAKENSELQQQINTPKSVKTWKLNTQAQFLTGEEGLRLCNEAAAKEAAEAAEVVEREKKAHEMECPNVVLGLRSRLAPTAYIPAFDVVSNELVGGDDEDAGNGSNGLFSRVLWTWWEMDVNKGIRPEDLRVERALYIYYRSEMTKTKGNCMMLKNGVIAKWRDLGAEFLASAGQHGYDMEEQRQHCWEAEAPTTIWGGAWWNQAKPDIHNLAFALDLSIDGTKGKMVERI
ncbi:hypothetical protein B0J17DRAFT_634312 [Rhizoctonia solani]|nr:hypothetical protein B0J17DRAFT_634312 [Rhizoctonia solani]